MYYGKVEPLYRPKWPIRPALYSSFLSIKRLRVLLLLPGWDASPLQDYPQHICWYPFVHLGEEKHCESKVSCLRVQHNDHGQGSNPDTMTTARARTWTTRSGVECTNHEATASPIGDRHLISLYFNTVESFANIRSFDC